MRIIQSNKNQNMTKFQRIFERILREGKDYYDPFFSGTDCINDEFWDDQPVRLEGADLDDFFQALNYFVSPSERPEDFDEGEFKMWCVSNGLVWDGVLKLARQMKGAFGDAYNTSIGLY